MLTRGTEWCVKSICTHIFVHSKWKTIAAAAAHHLCLLNALLWIPHSCSCIRMKDLQRLYSNNVPPFFVNMDCLFCLCVFIRRFAATSVLIMWEHYKTLWLCTSISCYPTHKEFEHVINTKFKVSCQIFWMNSVGYTQQIS